LQREHDLRGHQQLPDRALAQPQHPGQRRHDRQRAGKDAALPAGNLEVEKAFQHHLTGHRAGERGALPGREQRHAEQQRRQAGPGNRRE